MWEVLCASVLSDELPRIVKQAVRAVVAERVPNSRLPRGGGGGGRYAVTDAIGKALLNELVRDEAREVVTSSLREIALDYAHTSAAEREYTRIVDGVMAGILPRIARDARLECALESVLDDALGPRIAEVASAAMRESRGAAARASDAAERVRVSQTAVESVLEPYMLERLLMHVGGGAGHVLLQR